MVDPGSYAAIETLRGGERLEIRALRHKDRAEYLAMVSRMSEISLRRRFFALKRNFSEKEISYFVDVDFKDHVALVGVVELDGHATIVGGGRYVVIEPGVAEVAFAVGDQYQGLGVGTHLLKHLIAIARSAGIVRFIAEVLAENRPMLTLFEKTRLPQSTHRQGDVIELKIALNEPDM